MSLLFTFYDKSVHRKHHAGGLRLLLFDRELHFVPHHHLRERFPVRVRHIDRTDIPSAAQHRTAVCNRLNLIQLVRDKYNRLPLADELPHNVHQLVNLLRRQHRRGLIKNQDIVITVEHF